MILRNEPQRHRVHRERISASVLGHFFIWKSLKDNLVRLSVGIEHYLDLQTDLENSLS
ncbi:MAG: hypothetical protein HEQ20_06160 [Aphanizomenon flos-aquae KM1D3_PB]|nr:hypothetical protein [Aphanizomenon sp. UHCC 0183]QSV74190.1 MAG: hypothetical protein HEQ20_06160 [Aphanizomenon flos-aquae KM1D3_PB]